MLVVDLSNYDYDHDVNQPDAWVPALISYGVKAVIIGSQWPDKAAWQKQKCEAGGLEIIATYAEPNVSTAIALADSIPTIAIVIEPGGVQDVNALRAGINLVHAASKEVVLYGNKGDVLSLTQGLPEFTQYPLWFASYFNDQHVVTSVDFWPELWGHQFTSSAVIAGRTRDLSEVFVVSQKDFDDLKIEVTTLRRIVGGPTADDFDLLKGLQNNQSALQHHLDTHPGSGDTTGLKRGDTVTLQ